MNSGLLYAGAAFIIWGLAPLYFREVASVPPLEMVLHRSAWSLAFMVVVMSMLRRWAWLPALLRQPRQVAALGLSACLLTINWLVYVWAVQNGRVVDSSLGYFINPLLNVLLGVVVLRERLRRAEWAAVGLAVLGVLWLTWQVGQPPWVALALASSFALYGLIRKTAPLGALEGLTMENLVLAPLVVPALWAWTVWGAGTLSQTSTSTALTLWILAAGPLTALPLLLFAAGARRLRLATLGLVQYLGPSLQLLLGVWVFHEPFDGDRLVGFALIWAALALYSASSLRRTKLASP